MGLCDGGPSHAGYPGSIDILKGMSSEQEGCGSWFGSFMSILSSRCVSIIGAVSQAHNAERLFCRFLVFLYPAASPDSYCHEYLCFLPLGGHIGLPTDSGSIKRSEVDFRIYISPRDAEPTLAIAQRLKLGAGAGMSYGQ